MIPIKLNVAKFDQYMEKSGVSFIQLSKHLNTEVKPSSRLIRDWLSGLPVASRWREAIAAAVGVDPLQLYNDDGSIKNNVIRSHRDEIASVILSRKGVTRQAVSAWRRGQTIDPDNFRTLCSMLGAHPVDILSAETKSVIESVLEIRITN